MQIEKFLKSFELPIKYYERDFDISERFNEESKRFIDNLEKIDGAEFKNESQKIQIQEKMQTLIPLVSQNVQRVI